MATLGTFTPGGRRGRGIVEDECNLGLARLVVVD